MTSDLDQPPLKPPAAFGCGLLMGGADAIPGVSGGTIALILGIYERFVAALSTVVRAPLRLRTSEGRRELGRALRLLLPLGIGIVLAYYAGTKVLVGKPGRLGLLQDPLTAPLCYGFFLGLVVTSLREPWRRIESHGPATVTAAVLGAAGAWAFCGLPYASREPETWMLFHGGALAICVMLLPGVSGSLLLLILNQYQAVVTAVHAFDVPRLAVFVAGLAVGVGAFVPLLRRLLRTHHDLTMGALTGLMAGSMRALWPWKTHYVPSDGPMTNTAVGDGLAFVIAAALAGAGVVLFLGRLEARLKAGRGAAT